ILGEDNRVSLKPVDIARDLGGSVELSGGLSLQDRIVATPPDGLMDGDQVRVATPVLAAAAASVRRFVLHCNDKKRCALRGKSDAVRTYTYPRCARRELHNYDQSLVVSWRSRDERANANRSEI